MPHISLEKVEETFGLYSYDLYKEPANGKQTSVEKVKSCAWLHLSNIVYDIFVLPYSSYKLYRTSSQKNTALVCSFQILYNVL